MGNTAGAQAIILKELNVQFGGSAEAANRASGGWDAAKVQLGNLQEAVGGIIQNEFLPALLEELVGGKVEGASMAQNIAILTKKVQDSGPEVRKFAKDVGSLTGDIVKVIGALKDAVTWLDKFIGKASAANKAASFVGNLNPTGLAKGLGGVVSRFAARQHGGPVNVGSSYLVGERGPEIFRPGSSGGIYTGGGGATYVTNVYVAGSVLSDYELEERIAEVNRSRSVRGR